VLITVHKEGHAGLTFLLVSPFVLLFRWLNINLCYIVATSILMAVLSSLPDLDLQWTARGVTHTFLAGAFFGIIFAAFLGYPDGLASWLIGFFAGFEGTCSHLLGDAFTYVPIKPFYPFSNKEISLGLFKSSNKTVNSVMFTLGIIAFGLALTI